MSPFACADGLAFCSYLKPGSPCPYAEASRKTERIEIPDCAQDGQTLHGNQEHRKGSVPTAASQRRCEEGAKPHYLATKVVSFAVHSVRLPRQTDAPDIIC